MTTYPDLDQSGVGNTQDRIAMGPTFGLNPQLTQGSRLLTAAGDYTVAPYDRFLLAQKTVPAPFTIFLPDLNKWMTQVYGLVPITIIDLAGVAGADHITITPFGGQLINGSGGATINTNFGALTLNPINNLLGWWVIQPSSTTSIIVRNQRSVTASPIVVGGTDEVLNCNIAGASTCALPTAASRGGLPVTFVNFGGASLVITPNGAETIDGLASVTVTKNWNVVTLVPFNDGVNSGWYIG